MYSPPSRDKVASKASAIQEQAYAFLDSLKPQRMALGLDRMRLLCEALGNPQNAVPTVHVAGTNGKGSVVAMLSAIATAQGLQVGATFSPHLQDVRERICINGHPVKEPLFVKAVLTVQKVATRLKETPTYFECLMAAAFWVFANQGVDLAIIETGLGGRLDASNVIAKPKLTVITSIDLDHMEVLGGTHEAIAAEKAGIFKADAPVVLGPSLRPEARDVLLEKMQQAQAGPFLEADASVLTEATEWQEVSAHSAYRNMVSGERYQLGVAGAWQQNNLATVLACVSILNRQGLLLTPKAVKEGLAAIRWPGRFQWLEKHSLIIDGSHNEAGFLSLAQTLDQQGARQHPFFCALSLQKNRPLAMVKKLLRQDFALLGVICTQPTTTTAPYHDPMALRRYIRNECPWLESRPIWAASDPACALWMLQGFLKSYRSHKNPGAQCYGLVTGSLYTAGEMLQLLNEPFAIYQNPQPHL